MVRLYLTAPVDDLASTVIRDRPVRSCVNDESTVQQIQHWLSTCQRLHPSCIESRSLWLPSRLVDVGLDVHCSTVHLRSTSTSQGIYLALSYCWGDLQQPVTTKHNIAQREAGISLEDLHQTIRDAISFTRKLGVQYLWVDALCIVQEDEDDWRTQIEVMGQVYKNAYVTIAASTAASVREGFLQTRTPLDHCVEIPLYVSPHSRGTVKVATWKFYNQWVEPLHLGCWSFQELVLSRRVLLFSKYELLWRCSTKQMLSAQESHIAYQDFRVLLRRVFEFRVHPSTSVQKQQREIWPNVVSDYSKRRVTYLLDRISALVGVANELLTTWQDTYILGMWARTFIQNLGWRVVRQQEICTRRVSERVPSWSWLSVENPVELWPLLHTSDAEVIHSLDGVRQVMTVEDLMQKCIIIHLRARAISTTSVVQHPFVTSTQLQKQGSFEYMIDLDVSNLEISNVDTLIVLLGYGKSKPVSALCLLLRHYVTQGSNKVWQRIGRIRVWNHDWSNTPYSSMLIR